MIISQHSFVPLGFVTSHYYDDNMTLQSNSTVDTTILSPCLGHTVFVLRSSGHTYRCFSPLFKSSISSFDVVLSSVFLFAYGMPHSKNDFNVVILNF